MMRMTPPTNSANLPYLLPSRVPNLIPTADIANVITPITVADTNMSLPSIARLMPTANASMLVAMARISIVTGDRSSSSFSSSPNTASRIMLAPISARRMKATQWS